MKKRLLIFFFFITLGKTKAQVVFCPPGAEWRYIFGHFFTAENEKIKYTGDTIIGGETLKILLSTRLYYNCNSHPLVNRNTFLKQKGDTVFFKNATTQNTWQILYNFACTAGQGWQTTVLKPNNSGTITLNFTVTAVSTVTINNMPLKRLTLGSDYITERFGWDRFLFLPHTPIPGDCDDLFGSYLCYKDNTFGLNQFTSMPCDYPGPAGLKDDSEASELKFFPNPASSLLTIEFPNALSLVSLNLADISGRIILSRKKEAFDTIQLNIEDIKPGIYFLRVFKTGKLIATEKVIKE